MNNWQPINTAPKDRRILLYYPMFINLEPTIREGFYNKDDYHFYPATEWQELPVFDGVIENV